MSRTPSMAEVLRDVIEHRLGGVHVCMPGQVVSYDPLTQTAEVQPTLRNVIETGDGTTEALAYPTISSVPVAHPRAGAWFVHMPLAAGDSVVLVFGERSLDEWRARGGVNVDPDDLRKHHLSDAIAIPGNLYPDSQALPALTAFGDGLSIGNATIGKSTIHIKDSGEIDLGSLAPLDSVATALKTDAQKTALTTALTTMIADFIGIGSFTGFGAASAAALTTLLANPAWTGSVASSKVKVDP